MTKIKKPVRTKTGNIDETVKKKVPELNDTHYILFIVFLIILFFSRQIFRFDGSFISGIDIAGYFYWNLEFVKKTFLSGSIPLWNPHFYSGHPFLANPSTFVFYPFTILFVLLPLPWAFTIDTIAHVIIAAAGMYLLVRLITASKGAGLAAGIIYSLSYYFSNRIAAGHLTLVHCAALIPWVFYFVENAFMTGKSKYFVIAGIALGLQIIGGDPQINLYTSLFISLYFFLRYYQVNRPIKPQSFSRGIMFFAAIPFFAFIISAIQILPSMEFMRLSVRADNTYEFASSMSFPLGNFFTLLVPNPATNLLSIEGEYACYLGLAALALAFAGGMFSRYKQHRIVLGALLFFALTIMLGSYTPLYHLYYKLIPFLSAFRVPARCIVIFTFSMSMLAGFGFQHICESGITKNQTWIAGAFSIVLLVLICIGVQVLGVPFSSKDVLTAVGLSLAVPAALAALRSIGSRMGRELVLISIIFIDMLLVCSPLIPSGSVNDFAQEEEFESIFAKDADLYRVNVPGNSYYGFPARGMKFNYYNINGNTPMILNDYFNFIYKMSGLEKPTFYRHTFTPDLSKREKIFSSKVLGLKYAVLESEGGLQMVAARNFQPRAVLVSDIVFSPALEDQIGLMKAPSFDGRRTVILEEGSRKCIRSDDYKPAALTGDDSVKIQKYYPNSIELKSRSKSNAILVLSELYCPGWKAYVDGQRVDILRADYLLRAIQLPPGDHDIVFAYRPMSFYIGASVTLSSLLLIIGTYFFYRSRQKNSGSLP